jgi:ribonuclease Z
MQTINAMSSMTYVQVVAVDCAFHSVCVVIGTENNRFLFEVGEGTQRLVIEHKVRISKIGGIFLTSSSPISLGGLPGMMLTMDDAGCSQLDIYAPIAAQHYLQATRNFMRPLGNFHAISSTNAAGPNNNKKINGRVTCSKKNELTVYCIPIGVGPKDGDPDGTLEIGDHACFIAETPIVPGKFFIEKAIELNIPKGPMYGKLKNGQSITLEDGTVITPDQVLGPPHPSQYVAIICRLDIDDDVMRNNLFNAPDFQPFYIGDSTIDDSTAKRFHMM